MKRTTNVFLVIAPIISSTAWLTMLIALLVLWLVNDKPKYKASSADITYISSVGAHYKWIFITCACITAAFFIISLLQFIVVHRLRAGIRNVPGTLTFKPRFWADTLALVCGIVSVSALVLLTIFDSINHETIHWTFTLVFSISAILCAIFNLIAVSSFRQFRHSIKASFVLKVLFIVLSTLVLIAMIAFIYSCSESADGTLTSSCNTLHSVAAVLEWSLAILFYIFIITWIIDFSKN